MLSATLFDQEEKADKTKELEIECGKLSKSDFSDRTISAITYFLELQTPLNKELFKYILMALKYIPSEYPANITAMFEALKKHPDLKNNTKVIFQGIDLVLSDVSIVTLRDIYPAHAKLVNEIFLLNPEVYNNKEFLDNYMYDLMRYNVYEDSFAQKIIELVDFSIFPTQDLINLLISIIRLSKFNSYRLIDKVFAADQALLDKTTPQQNYILFKYAFINHFYSLADKVVALEFDPNIVLEHNISSREITIIETESDTLIRLISEHSAPKHIPKYLHFVVKKGVDLFYFDKYLHSHPISFILENKLLNEIKIYFINSREKLQKIEHYLIITALFYGTSNNKTKKYYQAFKESGLLNDEFINTFEKMLESGIDLVKINKLYSGFLDWWLENLVLRTDKLSYFKKLSEQDFFRFISQIFLVPELGKQFSPYLARLDHVYFGDGGKSSENWSQLAALVFRKSKLYKKPSWANLQPSLAPFFRNRKGLKLHVFDKEDKLHQRTHHLPSEQPIKSKRLKLEHSIIPGIKYLSSLAELGFGEKIWKFHAILGRTIQMKNAQGDILAFKLQKRNEDLSDLQKEYTTADYLRKYKKLMKLQSAIHKPEVMVSIDNVQKLLLYDAEINPEQLKTLERLVDLESATCAYVYSVQQKDTGCFTYLHNITISDEEFTLANRIAISDLIQLFKYGFYFYQLADMFHADREIHYDRHDGCRYRTLVNVINKTPYGKGEVDKWLLATEYLNIRITGLVDWDWIAVGDLFNPNDEFTFNNYCIPRSGMASVHRSSPDANIGNISAMNSIVEYLMILELCVGRRGRMLTEKALNESANENDIKQLWLMLANQMMNNAAQAIAIFCHIPEFKAREVLHAWINVNRYAEQMEFWMTNKYIPYVDEGKPLPKSLYGEKVTAVSVRSRFRHGTFNTQVGFSANGKDPDLGIVNSQHPIKEGDALMYVVAMIMTTIFNQNEFDTEKLKKSIEALDEKKYAEADVHVRSITGFFPQHPRLHVNAMKLIDKNLQEEKPDKDIERNLWKQKQIHAQQIEKHYGYRWLSMYKYKKVTKVVAHQEFAHSMRKLSG